VIDHHDTEEFGKLLLRLGVGILMLFHGYSKFMNPGSLDWIGGTLAGNGLPSVLAYGVYVGEVVAPLMIIVGLYARLGGWLIVVNMLFAIGLAHSGELLSMGDHGGWALELQGFYLLGGLIVAMLGSGKFAFRPD
jgi:putative oxidoreductase